jgi:hypothetical protein
MAGKPLLFLFIFLPLSLQAQVYHCDGPGAPVYSQIPCAENAEIVTIYDPAAQSVNASEPDSNQAGSEQDDEIEAVVEPPSPMENFVATLNSQRQQQLAEIDENIARLKKSLKSEGELALDEMDRQSAVDQLAALESDRSSIDEQYASLISEAEQRARTPESIN